jgi:TRAP transporter TAXI family solute receptor
VRWLAWLILAALLAGCAREPDEASLRAEVETRLAAALPEATVEVSAFARRGSQRDSTAPADSVRRNIYFDVELRLLRDYDFGAWDAPGVAGLVGALGSGPKGLRGIETGGNRAGEVIRAHGVLLYERRDDTWVALQPQGFGPVTAPALAGGAASAPERLLGALQDTMARVPPEASPAVREALGQELQHAYAAVNARLARFDRGYAIAAGPEGGQYLRLVQAFAVDPAARIVPLVTAGGEENLRLLREGRVDLALSQGDAVLAAYRGEGAFADAGPYPQLRAIGSLYPEVVHVIVREDAASTTTMAALRGQRVAVGAAGSAARATALDVLAAHGLDASTLQLRELALGAALVALRERTVDAVVTVIGLPADSIRVAATALPLRLLDLDASAVSALAEVNPAFLPFTIARGTYAGSRAATRSLATPAVLLVRAELSNAEVEAITRAVFAPRRDLVARGSSQGAQLSAANAQLGIPVPQHEAASRALASLRAPVK